MVVGSEKSERWLVLEPIDDGSIRVMAVAGEVVREVALFDRLRLRQVGLSNLIFECKAQSASATVGLALVNGTGSFTSARLAAAVMNTAHFLEGLPIALAKKRAASYRIRAVSVVRPLYSRPANITKAKKKLHF
ncbi:MAG: hypothetical protein WC052_02420 [Patescibacteria group bacterium]